MIYAWITYEAPTGCFKGKFLSLLFGERAFVLAYKPYIIYNIYKQFDR